MNRVKMIAPFFLLIIGLSLVGIIVFQRFEELEAGIERLNDAYEHADFKIQKLRGQIEDLNNTISELTTNITILSGKYESLNRSYNLSFKGLMSNLTRLMNNLLRISLSETPILLCP